MLEGCSPEPPPHSQTAPSLPFYLLLHRASKNVTIFAAWPRAPCEGCTLFSLSSVFTHGSHHVFGCLFSFLETTNVWWAPKVFLFTTISGEWLVNPPRVNMGETAMRLPSMQCKGNMTGGNCRQFTDKQTRSFWTNSLCDFSLQKACKFWALAISI